MHAVSADAGVDYLASRAAAGGTLGVGTHSNHEAHPDAPEARDRWFDFHGGAYFFASGRVPMIAYGADLHAVLGGYVPLHGAAVCAPHDAVELARLPWRRPDIDLGQSKRFCWFYPAQLVHRRAPTDSLRLATFLIEEGVTCSWLTMGTGRSETASLG